MRVLMAHQLSEVEQFELIAERFFTGSVFAGFMMFESFAAAMIAQRYEKFVAALMTRTKQRISFLNHCSIAR